jgi:PIN domain nuclease of toxin-antitoxin system
MNSLAMTTIKPYYVVDTNALIWYLTSNIRLSNKAKSVFEAAERGETRLIISAIVIAELYYANQKNNWFTDFAQLFQDLKSKPYFRFVPFTADSVLDFSSNKSVPEMHDRIIGGLAKRLDAPLITIDPLITAAGLVEIVW